MVTWNLAELVGLAASLRENSYDRELNESAAQSCSYRTLGGHHDQGAYPSSTGSDPVAASYILRDIGSEISRGRRPDGEPQGSRQSTSHTKRGDAFQIILIKVKGGQAPTPTAEDGYRLLAVAGHHRARRVLLAALTNGKAARFFRLGRRQAKALGDWIEVEDRNSIFR
jgi:hypothetical protein